MSLEAKKRNQTLANRRDALSQKLYSLAKRTKETINFIEDGESEASNTSDIRELRVYLQTLYDTLVHKSETINETERQRRKEKYEYGHMKHQSVKNNNS